MKIWRIVVGVALMVGALVAENMMAQSMDSVEGDRRALVDLYNATNGDNWDNNSGWLNGNPSNNWHGIEVDGNGRVVKVKLNGTGFGQNGIVGGNNLVGTLPASIGNLTKVIYFNVKQNKLTGEIPSSIGNMVTLVYLGLNGQLKDMENNRSHHPGKPHPGGGSNSRSNNYSGSIPKTIGELTNLEWIELTGSGKSNEEGLTGAVPSSIGNLTNLKGFQISFNSINKLPDSMGDLVNLQNIAIGDMGPTMDPKNSALAGTGFPQWIGKLTKLREIFLGENRGMGGQLPDMSALTDLRVLLLDFNDITGPIPADLIDGSKPNINMLQLAWNDFSGDFPEIKEPNRLTAFTLEGNNISGKIHPSWGTSAARRLINFGVGWNNLEGEFPDMDHAYQLRYIRAINNNFSGPLPALHTNNKKLSRLYFQGNNFSGPIDPSITEAVKNGRDPFFEVNISNNRFCESDMEGFVSEIEALEKVEKFRYGGQQNPVCGDGSSGDGGNDSGDGGNGNDSEPTVEVPTLLAPAHQRDDVTLTPTFEWSDEGADAYQLHITKTGQEGTTIDVSVNGTTFTLTDPLQTGVSYIWRVKAVHDETEVKWSELREFKTELSQDDRQEQFVGTPELLAPESMEQIEPALVTFEWSSVDADGYILHLSRENEQGSHEDVFLSDSEKVAITDTTYTLHFETLPGKTHSWRVRGVKDGVEGEWSEVQSFVTDAENHITSAGGSEGPIQTGLNQNYPNPFNPSTQIEFTLSELQKVSLKVYDMAGRQVAVLVDGVKHAGRHIATFSAGNHASGIYFYRFMTNSQVYTKKMTLVK